MKQWKESKMEFEFITSGFYSIVLLPYEFYSKKKKIHATSYNYNHYYY